MESRTLEDAIRRHIRFSLCQRIEECDSVRFSVARMGRFSSDRSVAEDARDIRDVRPA